MLLKEKTITRANLEQRIRDGKVEVEETIGKTMVILRSLKTRRTLGIYNIIEKK